MNVDKYIHEILIKSIIENNQLIIDAQSNSRKNGNILFVDNINGDFDLAELPMHRESGVGSKYKTWCRSRALIYALLKSLDLPLILPFVPESAKNISGMGISDDLRYADALSKVFTYVNTFYHKEPQLDLMKQRNDLSNSFDFIICSDVFEHIIGDWRIAMLNIYDYLKVGGVFILTVPLLLNIHKNIEHYPGAIDYQVINDGSEVKVIVKYNDREEKISDPVFHGGPGNTLEMRIFSMNDLSQEIKKIGFREVNFYELNQPIFGIDPTVKHEGVFAIFK